LLDDAPTVDPAHVRELVGPCLAHRVVGRAGVDVHAVLDQLLASTPVPADAPARLPRRPSSVELGYDITLEGGRRSADPPDALGLQRRYGA
jgi:hypothetical protein